MNRYQEHYKTIINYDLINKHNCTYVNDVPSIKNTYLNISSVNITKKLIILLLLLFRLIINQQSTLTFSKKNKIHLKVKKGSICGCKTVLN